MRWFTCTPVEFGGGADFFARDSGLLSRGFQALGVESRAVMPGERQAGDEADLIRTDYGDLESADWWRAQQLDGVVLYAWGRPKFRKVAAAIRAAGIGLVLNQDNGGLVSPLAGLRDWLEEQRNLSGDGGGWAGRVRYLLRVARGLSYGLVVTDPLRAEHLQAGDVIACVSPKAAEYYRKLCRRYGGAKLAGRVAVIPHAVEPRFGYGGEEKRRQVVCVGRWGDEVQKRPRLLMEVIGGLLAADGVVRVVIAGEVTAGMELWHNSLDGGRRGRVRLVGRVDRAGLAGILRESQVFYSPSAYESFGIAAAEALCCGCSVVAERSVSMASFEWFVGGRSGTLAEGKQARDHQSAVERELDGWGNGGRNAAEISGVWCERLHAGRVAEAVLRMMREGVSDK